MTKIKNITGQVFGNLTVLNLSGRDRHNRILWNCSCACGNETLVTTGALNSGNSKSCGCGRGAGFRKMIEVRKNNAFGIHHVRARNSWHHMIDRCTNQKNKHFKDYGGRGITVCERWLDLRTFVADMGDPPTGMTLDRINCNGNYEPGNCKWSTAVQQAQNTRRNVYAKFGEEVLCISEIAKRIDVPASTLYARIAIQKRIISERIGNSFA